MVKLLRKKYYRLYQIFLWCWEIPCQIYYENMIAKPRYIDDRRLLKFGFKSYSQNDEDGIIREIFNRIGTTNKYFVEFGVQNGIECNTHLLLVSGWGGLWIEADKKHWISANRRFSRCVDERKLKIVNEFVDAENINNILRDNNIQKEIDFLSIDVDGNDIWIWRAIEAT